MNTIRKRPDGIWNAFVGKLRVKSFGKDERAAKDWLAEADGWRPATDVPPEFRSTDMKVRPLILAVKGYPYGIAGYYHGDLDEWFFENSNTSRQPTYWRPMPRNPENK